MSDAIPLPPRPNLEQYKKLAKDLQRACNAGDSAKIRGWAVRWTETMVRLRSSEVTPQVHRQIAAEAERIEQRWSRFRKPGESAAPCALAEAQFFLAREHGFASWPRFAEHVRELSRAHSPAANFEAAADAIVRGDLAKLRTMLADDPSLVRARSMRDHRSTLLHYVSANGIEDFRQKTPGNICEMAQLLLEAGADVNAESDAYGGGSTTLLLVATSVHPDRAGVQLALLDLLLDHGATIERPGGSGAVNACLHNGRARAAEFLASRGARLDLEGAAGVGQLDVVQSFFLADGSLRPPATMQQLVNGFCWACQFGHSSTVRLLLRHGVRAEAAINAQHQTGLHHAALGGNVDIIRTLLQHGADVNARETAFGGTPLGWALHGWANAATGDDAPRYCEAVAVLVQAGASTAEFTMPKDSRMQAALRGEYRVI